MLIAGTFILLFLKMFVAKFQIPKKTLTDFNIRCVKEDGIFVDPKRNIYDLRDFSNSSWNQFCLSS